MMADLFGARSGRWVFLLCALMTLGCAGLETVDIQPAATAAADPPATPNGWWFVRFQWHWPEDRAPAWHLDLLAAHQILLPAIATHEEGMLLWRVHRRAARDESGHRFSLLFFASAQTAQAVYARVANAAILGELVNDGLLRQVLTKPLSEDLQTEIDDTSDPAWSAAMRAGWPYYIHGASRMWLHLVNVSANRMIQDSAPFTLVETIELYRRVDAEINDIWQKEGHHALLHHLNAIFGYRPIPVRF